MASPEFSFILVRWPKAEPQLRFIRQQVFVDEHGIPEALEWDGEDEAAWHVLALDAHSNPIGTGRILKNGHIGRMAVLPRWRGYGVGGAILVYLIHIAQCLRLEQVWLNSQDRTIGFYERRKFISDGALFEQAGIAHQKMVRLLNDGATVH